MSISADRPRTTAQAAAWAMACIDENVVTGDTRGEKIQGLLAAYKYHFYPLTRADIHRLMPVVLMVAQEFLAYV